MAVIPTRNQQWWKESVVYQIYPASFKDSNDDGWGDIVGITSKLDHLKDLGVDVVWLSPIYKSPQVDMGYDISDYESIDPMYGTLEEVDIMIAEMKKRDLKLVMDFVANHTSDQHAWFKESRSAVDSPKRDWYIWKKPSYDKQGNRVPPNNWAMILGKEASAWTWDEVTQEYYLGLFTAAQPDLNWDNPEVRTAIYDVLRFWLNRGCSGFRMDVINLISKDPAFPDAKIVQKDAKYQSGHEHYANGPRMHEYLHEMNREVLSKYDTLTVGEMPHIFDDDEILRTVGASAEELNMIFIFDIVDIDAVPGEGPRSLQPWDVTDLKKIISRWQKLMFDRDGWNAIFCENHDTPRSLTRYCDDSDEFRERGAKLLCTMLTTLGGTLYVFQGQELGMRNLPIDWDVEEYKDIGSTTYWEKVMELYHDNPEKLKQARKILHRKARDNTRSPMQWTSEPNGGFTGPGVKPWMRVNDDYLSVNVASQKEPPSDPDNLSVLKFWQRSLALRKEYKDVLVYGDFDLIGREDDKNIFAYKRWSESKMWVTVLNFSGDDVPWEFPEDLKMKNWMMGNYGAGNPDKGLTGSIIMRPWESVSGECSI